MGGLNVLSSVLSIPSKFPDLTNHKRRRVRKERASQNELTRIKAAKGHLLESQRRRRFNPPHTQSQQIRTFRPRPALSISVTFLYIKPRNVNVQPNLFVGKLEKALRNLELPNAQKPSLPVRAHFLILPRTFIRWNTQALHPPPANRYYN